MNPSVQLLLNMGIFSVLAFAAGLIGYRIGYGQAVTDMREEMHKYLQDAALAEMRPDGSDKTN